ncbi:MAG: HD domain-containing protein [Anaerolineales bacterium]
MTESSRLALSDPLYGTWELEEPLLLELYRSRAVQRLAHIYQAGATAFVKTERNTTRLEHSVGVMLLLRRLGASVEEQAAGLLHDVPHTAFSHVVDFVFPNHQHAYHEEHRETFIATTDLPGVLERQGVDWRWLSEAENFSLLEQPLPALCADRLDYFLRDGYALGLLDSAEVGTLLDHLQVWEGRIVVDDLEAARLLGERFIDLDDAIWCNVQEVGWYALMARALQAAMAAGLLDEEDFWGTDEAIMARLRATENEEVQRWLHLLRRDVDFARVAEGGDLQVLPKVRAVDPPVLEGEGVVPLSRLDPAFAARRRSYVTRKEGGWALRILHGG